MKFIKSLIYAFSMYSTIPMPDISYEDDDFKYALCAFPFVGVFIGIVFYGWNIFCNKFGIGIIARVLISSVISIVISGGIHIDGYMDTMDAIHSYKSIDEKLEILKDSHIGAFSVIMVALYYMVYFAALSEIREEKTIFIVSAGFMLSRIFSALSAILLLPAKSGGSLKNLTDKTDKKTVSFFLIIELLICMLAMMKASLFLGMIVPFAAVVCFVLYKHFSYKEFGGVTGDTAGCFLLMMEVMTIIISAIGERI